VLRQQGVGAAQDELVHQGRQLGGALLAQRNLRLAGSCGMRGTARGSPAACLGSAGSRPGTAAAARRRRTLRSAHPAPALPGWAPQSAAGTGRASRAPPGCKKTPWLHGIGGWGGRWLASEAGRRQPPNCGMHGAGGATSAAPAAPQQQGRDSGSRTWRSPGPPHAPATSMLGRAAAAAARSSPAPTIELVQPVLQGGAAEQHAAAAGQAAQRAVGQRGVVLETVRLRPGQKPFEQREGAAG
jgi:hypothetical protein